MNGDLANLLRHRKTKLGVNANGGQAHGRTVIDDLESVRGIISFRMCTDSHLKDVAVVPFYALNYKLEDAGFTDFFSLRGEKICIREPFIITELVYPKGCICNQLTRETVHLIRKGASHGGRSVRPLASIEAEPSL